MLRFPQLVAASTVFLLTTSSTAMATTPVALAQVFDPEMINADLAYFERVTGPARNTYGNTKVYKIGGCEVTAT